MSERILLFPNVDKLREWAADKAIVKGGWFDQGHVYHIVNDRPIQVIVEVRE